MVTMAEWFGLRDGHSDFCIENDVHAALLFARSQLDEQLQRILRKSFRTGNPPKFVLYGNWGTGKTHTMRHIEHVVGSNPDFAAHVVFVELPDITKRSKFTVAHAALLDALGLDRVKQWLTVFQGKHQGEAFVQIQRWAQSEDIAKALVTLTSYGENSRLCWDWLRGLVLSGSDAKNVGLPTSLSQSTQLVAVLRLLGRLCREVDDSMLILMVDEATKLLSVNDGDAIGHWVNAFKILADKQTKDVGFIISASFSDPDDMPTPLADQQIRSRFGLEHYIALADFGPDEAVDFLTNLLREWIEPGKREQLIDRYAAELEGEAVVESFPFTKSAFSTFVDYTCRNGGITNPRDIQQALDDILNRAIDDDRHILSSSYLAGLFAAV